MSQIPDGFSPAHLGPAFGAEFGPVFVDRTRQRLGFVVLPRHGNADAVCHGGAMATFADQQLLALLPASDDTPAVNPTISLSIDYLAPARVGAWVEAQVMLVRETRTMFFTQVILSVEGEPVARSTAIYRKRKTPEQTK